MNLQISKVGNWNNTIIDETTDSSRMVGRANEDLGRQAKMDA